MGPFSGNNRLSDRAFVILAFAFTTFMSSAMNDLWRRPAMGP